MKQNAGDSGIMVPFAFRRRRALAPASADVRIRSSGGAPVSSQPVLNFPACALGSKMVASCSRPVHGEGCVPDHSTWRWPRHGLEQRLLVDVDYTPASGTASVRPTDQGRLAVRTAWAVRPGERMILSSYLCHKSLQKCRCRGEVSPQSNSPRRSRSDIGEFVYWDRAKQDGGANGFHVRPAGS